MVTPLFFHKIVFLCHTTPRRAQPPRVPEQRIQGVLVGLSPHATPPFSRAILFSVPDGRLEWPSWDYLLVSRLFPSEISHQLLQVVG